MELQFDLPVVATKELDLMCDFENLTKEELLQKKKELELENDEFQKEYAQISEKYMKLRATKDAFLNVDMGCEYIIDNEETHKSNGEEYLSLDMELKIVGKKMSSARERLELSKDELSAVERAIAKREILEYRKNAENSYQRFLEITDVKRVDDEGNFIFVTKKQLMAFWDRASNYTPDNYCIYGMIDICDVTEEDIQTASVISDGKHFYRGIKEDYSSRSIEYWAVDYSDIALGKYMKPIQNFAVNLKELLVGATSPVPYLIYEKRDILKRLIENVPTAVGAVPYEILVDKDCREIIVEALGVAVGKLFDALNAGVSSMSEEAVTAFKEELMNTLVTREKLASQKFKKMK